MTPPPFDVSARQLWNQGEVDVASGGQVSVPADLRLIHHHIGGRAGDTGFDLPQAFERDVVRVLYDADADSVAHAEQRSTASGRTTIVRPYFVGAPGRKVTFHINYCPYLSSGRVVKPSYQPYYLSVSGTDYSWAEAGKTIRTVEIESQGLDQITLGEGADLPPPDLLSIDTEGGEDDVIVGAPRLLDDYVVAVIAEVKFHPVYVGGPQFGDISAMLQRHGFLFAEFEMLGRMSPLRGRLGTRGRGLTVYGDALYFKDPEAIANRLGDRAGIALHKLAFTAICRGYFEFAQHCLSFCPASTLPAGEIPIYLRFVDQFRRLCETTPDVKPWSFVEAFTAETSQARFSTVSEADGARINAEFCARAKLETQRIMRNEDDINRAASTPALARLFERYGMSEQAKILIETQKQIVGTYIGNAVQWSEG